MARDRKRAKQRQRKRDGRPQQQQPKQRKPPARVPDAEPELPDRADVFEPVDATDTPAPPGPSAGAPPDAEIAEPAEAGLQEPGAPVGRPLDEKDYPHPDELEGA